MIGVHTTSLGLLWLVSVASGDLGKHLQPMSAEAMAQSGASAPLRARRQPDTNECVDALKAGRHARGNAEIVLHVAAAPPHHKNGRTTRRGRL